MRLVTFLETATAATVAHTLKTANLPVKWSGGPRIYTDATKAQVRAATELSIIPDNWYELETI